MPKDERTYGFNRQDTDELINMIGSGEATFSEIKLRGNALRGIIVKLPTAGIPARTSSASTTTCDVFNLSSINAYVAHVDSSSVQVTVAVLYHGSEPIIYPPDAGVQYRIVFKDSQGNWTLPQEFRDYIITFTLTASLASGVAAATRTSGSGSPAITVRDIHGMFHTLRTGDTGIALMERDKYIVIQAPCPT